MEGFGKWKGTALAVPFGAGTRAGFSPCGPTYERLHADSLLAFRAIMAAAPGNDDALNWRFANKAGFHFAAIDTMLELEESFFSIRVNIIRNRRTAQRYGFGQNLLNGGKELT